MAQWLISESVLQIDKKKVCSVQNYNADLECSKANNKSALFIHFCLPYIHITDINGLTYLIQNGILVKM